MAKGSWYGAKKSGDKGGKHEAEGEKKPEGMHERHARERGETHQRHAQAREAMNKSHEDEIAAMAQRHADEAMQNPGGNDGAPVAPNPVQGATSVSPPAAAGAAMPQGAAA